MNHKKIWKAVAKMYNALPKYTVTRHRYSYMSGNGEKIFSEYKLFKDGKHYSDFSILKDALDCSFSSRLYEVKRLRDEARTIHIK